MRDATTVLIAGCIALLMSCATPSKHNISVDSSPTDALVTIYKEQDGKDLQNKKIAGATPMSKEFEFGKDNQLWFEFEKRGYITQRVSARPDTDKLEITLDRLLDSDGVPVPTYSFPEINRILCAVPKFKIIERGFSSESVSQDKSHLAQMELIDGARRFFGPEKEIILVPTSSDPRRLRTIWRDVKNVLEYIDPIRLKYQPEPLRLETKSSRSAAKHLGNQYHADVILLFAGKQNKETAGMLAGKIGMTAIGTANSYSAGYSRAMAQGDSYFVYNIYTPHFAQGAMIHAVMIDCRTGEIIWANRGGWPPIAFNRPEAVDQVLQDLLFGLK